MLRWISGRQSRYEWPGIQVETGMVAKYPTLIVITALWIIAIISFFSGVILQVLKKQHRHNFERHLNLLNEIWSKES